MEENHITLTELIIFMLYAGCPVFLIARIVQGVIFFSYKAPWKLIIATLIISQIITLALEVTIWRFFNTDPIFYGISLPALSAEIIILLITFLFINFSAKKWA